MAQNPFTKPDAPAAEPSTPPAVAPAALDLEAIAKSDPQIVSGARWFWWIAGLSLVNTVLIHSGSDTSFVIGLGFTLVADAIFQELKVVAFSFDAIALGFFFAMGWFAAKGRMWAFIVGIVAYVLDAGIYLFFQDWMPLAFHALALVYMGKAAMALRTAIQLAQLPKTEPAPKPVAAG